MSWQHTGKGDGRRMNQGSCGAESQAFLERRSRVLEGIEVPGVCPSFSTAQPSLVFSDSRRSGRECGILASVKALRRLAPPSPRPGVGLRENILCRVPSTVCHTTEPTWKAWEGLIGRSHPGSGRGSTSDPHSTLAQHRKNPGPQRILRSRQITAAAISRSLGLAHILLLKVVRY